MILTLHLFLENNKIIINEKINYPVKLIFKSDKTIPYYYKIIANIKYKVLSHTILDNIIELEIDKIGNKKDNQLVLLTNYYFIDNWSKISLPTISLSNFYYYKENLYLASTEIIHRDIKLYTHFSNLIIKKIKHIDSKCILIKLHYIKPILESITYKYNEKSIDIKDKFISTLIKNKKIIIPYHFNANKLFGDPSVGNIKNICIKTNGNKSLYINENSNRLKLKLNNIVAPKFHLKFNKPNIQIYSNYNLIKYSSRDKCCYEVIYGDDMIYTDITVLFFDYFVSNGRIIIKKNINFNNIFCFPHELCGKNIIIKKDNKITKKIFEKRDDNIDMLLTDQLVSPFNSSLKSIDINNIHSPLEKVSVIIPTFNRFKYLLNTIKSVNEQTYPNLEIIVVNDKSTQGEYYDYDWNANNIIIIHLGQNTKDKFGYASAGYVRNCGIEKSTGKYIAFCDDDDIWFPKKIELQLNLMYKSGCKMSSTDGLIGIGMYENSKKYKKYNGEHHYGVLKNIHRNKNSNLLEHGFSDIWSFEFLKIHNCIICSSVMIEKGILDKINNFKNMKHPGEDYDCWLRSLKHTDCIYIDDICFYYDNGHGDGRNY